MTRLGISKGTVHPVFGSMADVYKQFVHHGILEKGKVRTDESDSIMYAWGPRAKIEYPENSIVGFMGEVKMF